MAPEPVYNNLRAIIEKLDVRRAQVYVEALIVEVSADKAAEFGIQWQALSGYNSTQTRVIGGTELHAARQRQQHHRRRGESRAMSGKGSRWA
jgi:general secretion pathway protein D